MLESFFANPVVVERLRGGRLGSHIESFAEALEELGYAAATARLQLRLLAEFGRWLRSKQIAVADVDERVAKAFDDDQCRHRRCCKGDRSTIDRFLEHLRSQGVVARVEREPDRSALARLERRYEQYLRSERGLTTATIVNYQGFIHAFLTERFRGGPLRLGQLGQSDISGFVLAHARTMSPGRAKLMVTALRSFLRFLLQRDEIRSDLASCVPSVANWRLSTVPKYLGTDEVEALLGSCDQNTANGRRDYAIVVLLARLGLRAGEVVAMQLEDIDWRAGEITVRGKGRTHDRLPLPAEVGEALAAYLRQDRPSCASRSVFVCAKAPRRGFAGPSTVSTIVRRALFRADLRPPVKGAHLLRHSLATGMLRAGASMAEIAQVLRHRSAATTEIYAKVDVDGLRSLGQPWPTTGVVR